MTAPVVPELTDDFLRQGAEYLICHADPVFHRSEKPQGVWAEWQAYLGQPDVLRAVWLWIARNLGALSAQYSDDDWAGFVWQAVQASGEYSFRHAVTAQDPASEEIATFLRRFYELVLLPRCAQDSPLVLVDERRSSKLDGACYMIGEDFNYFDDLPAPVFGHLRKAIEYALNSSSFTLQHSALHALGHLHSSHVADIQEWRTDLLEEWLHKYDSGLTVGELSPEEQQRLRHSAFLVEPQGKRREAALSYGRPVPPQLVFYARAALQGTVL